MILLSKPMSFISPSWHSNTHSEAVICARSYCNLSFRGKHTVKLLLKACIWFLFIDNESLLVTSLCVKVLIYQMDGQKLIPGSMFFKKKKKPHTLFCLVDAVQPSSLKLTPQLRSFFFFFAFTLAIHSLLVHTNLRYPS